jgi:hypothetical protein
MIANASQAAGLGTCDTPTGRVINRSSLIGEQHAAILEVGPISQGIPV